jgi:hypothetical protein
MLRMSGALPPLPLYTLFGEYRVKCVFDLFLGSFSSLIVKKLRLKYV